jgi:uncharacterized protein (DUF302 family)
MRETRTAWLRRAGLLPLVALAIVAVNPAFADNPTPYAGTITLSSDHGFNDLVARLEKSIEANKMGLVARASASGGAAARGVKIPGNAVLMVFRNDYAVRMLAASVPAGVEAPLRLYVTQGQDGKGSITYRRPSAVFAPYQNAELDKLARELDPVVEKIVRDAVGK